MQNSKEIIEKIVSKPSMRKIASHQCFNKLKSLLPKHMAKYILFIYIKHDTLFFVLNHPGMKMEFYYKNSLLKSLVKNLSNLDTKCEHLKNIKKIKSFVSNRAEIDKKTPSFVGIYKERATGEFENLAKNEEIRKIIEEIKEIIRKKREV